MDLTNLWDELEPQKSNIDVIRKDLADGKVPELPYFIVGQGAVKEEVSTKLLEIKRDTMLTTMVIGQYGNGKTNLIKYLQLYFKVHTEENIKVIYSRIDIEQPDLVLMLLKLLQMHSLDDIIKSINILKSQDVDVSQLTHNFQDNFAAIEEYSKKIFEKSLGDEEIKKLIYLGTGRLYTKNHFANFNLEQLTNFNRREVLVLFLNILASNNNYILFGIDEVEKISEKSKLRFNQFLTSYRELIDLSNKIKGHYLITCFTDARGQAEISLANPAFYSRIEKHLKELHALSEVGEITQLTKYLAKLFEVNKSEVEITKIVSQIRKDILVQNRSLIRYLVDNLLKGGDFRPLKQLLKDFKLKELYQETYDKLEIEGGFKLINRKFFDPLEYYLGGKSLKEDGNRLERRDLQSFIDNANGKVHYFIFNENSIVENVSKRVDELVDSYYKNIVIYSPDKLELKTSSILVQKPGFNCEIIDYEPKDLFTLLTMYRDNFNKQGLISDVIAIYTKNNL